MACRYKVTVLEKAQAVAGHLPPGAPHVTSASVSPISKPPFSSTNAPPPKKNLKITRKEGKMSQQINQMTVTEGL